MAERSRGRAGTGDAGERTPLLRGVETRPPPGLRETFRCELLRSLPSPLVNFWPRFLGGTTIRSSQVILRESALSEPMVRIRFDPEEVAARRAPPIADLVRGQVSERMREIHEAAFARLWVTRDELEELYRDPPPSVTQVATEHPGMTTRNIIELFNRARRDAAEVFQDFRTVRVYPGRRSAYCSVCELGFAIDVGGREDWLRIASAFLGQHLRCV